LLECLERDAMALWWHGGLAAAALPLDLIDNLQPRLFWWLKERQRRTLLLDLTTDTEVPVVAAVSADAEGRHVATGAAARLNRAEAALSAVTEMLQTEAAMAQAAAAGDPDYRLWCDHADMQTMAQFQTRSAIRTGDGPVDMAAILLRLGDLGHRALIVDLTLPDDPQPTVRVIVPGLCAMRGRIDVPRFSQLTGRSAATQTSLIEPF
jgi:ribosomal protein S12 methylthiotransferase accessory factor